jgi:16S rRNA (cytosine967-C5)-methyltransferase
LTPSARIAAAIALVSDIEAEPRRPADAIANDFFRTRRYIGSGDRRSVAERAWGVLRQNLRLAWHLEQVGLPVRARHLVIAHMLLCDHWAPDGVEQAFPGGRFNSAELDMGERKAVLALSGRQLIASDMPEAVRMNLPEWALASFRARFGAELPLESAAMDKSAPLDMRANLLRGSREDAADSLAAEGIETEQTPYSPWGLRITERRQILATKAFLEGLIEIQDEGSQLIALLTGAKPGMRVADYCAGAAGKTLAVAAMMGNKGRIVACDVSTTRLEGAVKRLRRAGVDNAERHLLEAGDRWVKRRAGQFDRVLVDAPCTGTGTWRRNPDARLRTTPRDVEELVVKQRDILDTTAGLVAKGGRLIYATCSVLPEENADQVAGFIDRHPEFEIVPFIQVWHEATDARPPAMEGDFMQLSPHRHGTDGFFAAVLQRGA